MFATKWTSSGIKMWFFPRNQIPADLTSEKPDSTRWGEPYVTFPFGPRCPPYHFENMVLVINLDFCGDWAGNVYPGGRNVCMAYVKNPANTKALSEAFWEINYVKARHKMCLLSDLSSEVLFAPSALCIVPRCSERSSQLPRTREQPRGHGPGPGAQT